MKPENIHVAMGERAAEFPESAGPIFDEHGEFRGDNHRGDLLRLGENGGHTRECGVL